MKLFLLVFLAVASFGVYAQPQKRAGQFFFCNMCLTVMQDLNDDPSAIIHSLGSVERYVNKRCAALGTGALKTACHAAFNHDTEERLSEEFDAMIPATKACQDAELCKA